MRRVGEKGADGFQMVERGTDVGVAFVGVHVEVRGGGVDPLVGGEDARGGQRKRQNGQQAKGGKAHW